MKRLGLTSVYLVFLLCLFALLSLPQNVIGQTAQANLVMLREFTLEPGGPAFTYEFTAAEDNPYTFAASWGSVVGLRLSLTGEGLGPLVQEGNPASLSFQARKGVKYTLKVSAAGQLPVTSVGQLQGGFQPGLVIAPVVAPATPIQLPGPESPTLVVQMLEPGTLLAGATPMPLPAPVSPDLIARLTMSTNLEAAVALLKADPTQSTVLLSGPIEQPQAGVSLGDGGQQVGAVSAISTIGSLDWKSGIQLRFWKEPSSYWMGGKSYYVGNMYSSYVFIDQIDFANQQAKGVAQLSINHSPEDCLDLLYALIELPPEPATYVVRFRLLDSKGTISPSWITGEKPAISLIALELWGDLDDYYVPLTVSTTPPGFVGVINVSPQALPTQAPGQVTPGMRAESIMLVLRRNPSVWGYFSPWPESPIVFGGLDIMRLY